VFGRRPKLAADKTPTLDREERVLAWAAAGPEQVVVATNRGLWLPGAAERLGWHEINKVTWNTDQVMRVVASLSTPAPEGFSVVTDRPPVSLTLTDPGDLPKRVQQRVASSVPYSSRYPLPLGSALVVGRRVAGRDGLSWFVRYEGGADPDDPATRQITSELVAQAKASISQPD
jgi:hypothetical protein